MAKLQDKICIIGAFDFINLSAGGQQVKSRELYYAFGDRYGIKNIEYVETFNWKKNPLKMLMKLHRLVNKCSIFIMLPAHNGVEIFSRILSFYKNRNAIRIYYDVIGGWLSEKLIDKPNLIKILKSFDGIWVETQSMQNDLLKLGLSKVDIVNNFKRLNILSEEELEYDFHKPYKVCIFSRINKNKGIVDAIFAIDNVNRKHKSKIYELDIYGPIDQDFIKEFHALLNRFNYFANYKGIINPNESVDVIKKYFALIFPTKYYTEGIPGTIIDAYAAGVPIISSLWLNYCNVFKPNITGYGYEFGNQKEFIKMLEKAAYESDIFLNMKSNCINEAYKFHPDSVMKIISQLIEKE